MASKELVELDWKKFVWEVTKGVALAVAAIFSFFASQSADRARIEAENAKNLAAERAQQSQLDIKAYELVEKTLSLDSKVRAAHGVAAAAIINALTKPPLRNELQNALRTGTQDPGLLKQLDDALRFDVETYPDVPKQDTREYKRGTSSGSTNPAAAFSPISSAWAQSTAGPLTGYRVDIFYCESSVKNQTDSLKIRADAALKKLSDSKVDITIRVRLLPILVQARPDYQVFSDEIRFNDEGNEKAAATQLAKILGMEEKALYRIDYRTPNYLSVFYCSRK